MNKKSQEQLTQNHTNFDPPPLFVEWMRSFELEEILSPLIYTVALWVKRTSPTNASLDDLAIACMDLSLWFFYLDDYDQEDYSIFFEKCSRILDGHQPTSDEAKIFHAYADIINRVAQRGYDMQYYLQARKEYLQCRLKLHIYRKNQQNNLSFHELFELRYVTIGLKFWMVLWEILGDFYLTPSERVMPEVQLTLRAFSCAYFLHNDLYSLVRDIKENHPNLVILHMKQNGGDITSSAQYIEELWQQEVNNFQNLSQSILNASPSENIRKYFQFMELCISYIKVHSLIEDDNPKRHNLNLNYAQELLNQANVNYS